MSTNRLADKRLPIIVMCLLLTFVDYDPNQTTLLSFCHGSWLEII